jgi:hypothetical protein
VQFSSHYYRAKGLVLNDLDGSDSSNSWFFGKSYAGGLSVHLGHGTAPYTAAQALWGYSLDSGHSWTYQAGGARLNTDQTLGKPSCNGISVIGTLWFTAGGAGVADTLEVCAKNAAGAYAWRAITLP